MTDLDAMNKAFDRVRDRMPREEKKAPDPVYWLVGLGIFLVIAVIFLVLIAAGLGIVLLIRWMIGQF